MRTWTAPLLVAAALAGCASRPPAPESPTTVAPAPPPAAAPASAPPAPPPPPPPTPAQQRSAAASTLAVERQWLASWFKGTPVVVAQRSDGAVVIDVPRQFCFAPGSDAVKPALAAVLDKVAESLRRAGVAEIQLIAAPADPRGGDALALQRAARVYAYLRSRGVATTRLAKPSVTGAAAVQLRLDAAPPA